MTTVFYHLEKLITWLVLIAFSATLLPAHALAQTNDLTTGVSAYHNQDYTLAVDHLTRVIEDETRSDDDLLTAYIYLASANFFLDKFLLAEDAVRNIFLLDTDFEPDFEDAALMRFFEEIRQEMLNTVRVTSQPPGARVYMDDQLIGTTPMIIEDSDPGTHFFKIEKDGYQDEEITLYIEPSTINRLEVNLKTARSKKWIWYLVGPIILGSAIATGLSLTGDSDREGADVLGEPPPPPQ